MRISLLVLVSSLFFAAALVRGEDDRDRRSDVPELAHLIDQGSSCAAGCAAVPDDAPSLSTPRFRQLLAVCAGSPLDGTKLAFETLHFDPFAESLPWLGGPLFVLQLAGDLVAWHLWCDLRELGAEKAQIHSNLRSLSLARAAGYSSPGWNDASTADWLLTWGRAMGRAELERLLALQGVDDEPRFQKLLEQVEPVGGG
jgi:hypothetical protein